jgi:hypothetical protein
MQTPIRLHVSPISHGKADGSSAHPFPSLVAARDALRTLRRRGDLKAPVQVRIAPGVYRLEAPLVFTPQDGGTAECPVTWCGDGGRPLVSGARMVTGWIAGTINDRPCWQVRLPDVKAGRWWFTQLFVNGRRRLRARFPKQGFYRFTGVPEEEAKLDPGGSFHGAMSACFAPGELRNFVNLADIDCVVPDHWYENHLRLASVDETAGVVRFATKGYSRFSRDETGRHTRFRLDHVAEACTDPGDWYLDRKQGLLSYIPLPGETPEATLVEAPALDLLLSVQGDALDPKKRVRHLRFEFLDLRHADWELPRENAGALQSAFNVPAAVRFVGAEDCALYGCRVSQVGGWAVDVLRGCHRNRIVACALHDLGGGGVKVGHEGGLPRGWVDGNHGAFRGMDAAALGWGPCREDPGGLLPGRDRAEPSATTVSDCSIHDGGIIFHSAIGVWIGDASRNRVVHNHIWNFNYSGISCGWNWGFMPAFTCDNRIEANRIHGIGHGVLSDMGAIYTLGRQAGTTISRNVIHDVHSYGYGGWGIYPDEGSSWMRIEDNVVCGTKCGGFHQHYGRDNLVRGNLFADAIENQAAVSRGELVRALTCVGNMFQGAGNGTLWQGNGVERSLFEGNVYAGDPDRPAKLGGKSWAEWQEAGRDRKGRFLDAMLLDAVGAAAANANPAALRAADIDPRRIAAVVAEAGPRFRDTLPASIDAVRPEPEVRRAIVESCLWPWPAEWPGQHPWSKLPSSAVVRRNEPAPVSLTLENRGDAPVKGRYRLKVVPTNAARLVTARTNPWPISLTPGQRTAWEAQVVSTGKARSFRVEAVAEGEGLTDSALYYQVTRELDVPRLDALPSDRKLLAALEALPTTSVDGNASLVAARLRIAVAGEHLLVRVDTQDANPTRGPDLWNGSSIELFVASAPGAARVQAVAVPPLDRKPAAVKVAGVSGWTVPDGAVATGRATPEGWTLAVALPLAAFGVDAKATTFAVDLVVNATAPGADRPCRTHLGGEQNPFSGTDGYAVASMRVR